MNTLSFVGRVSKAPELTRHGDTTVCRFNLMRNESRGKDQNGTKREDRVVSIQFTAFDGYAKAIQEHCLVGDQLIVEARVEDTEFTDKDGKTRYGHNFVIVGFEFGAPGPSKREILARKTSDFPDDYIPI